MEVVLESSRATEELGGRLAGVAERGAIIYLSGELGSGKTTLVRGFLRALGHRGVVRSPTYTLVEPYSVGGKQIVHLDLYRLADPEELEFIGLRDFLDGRGVLLIEWPERGRGALPRADIVIEMSYRGAARRCRLSGISAGGKVMLSRLEA